MSNGEGRRDREWMRRDGFFFHEFRTGMCLCVCERDREKEHKVRETEKGLKVRKAKRYTENVRERDAEERERDERKASERKE